MNSPTPTPTVSLPTDNNPSPTPAPAQRAGSGGRWLYGLGRALLWITLVVVLINGVLRLAGVGTGAAPVQEVEPGPEFPMLEASQFAVAFADVYLETDPDVDRLALLSEYVGGESTARGMLPPLGAWEVGEDLYVASVTPADEHNAVVTLTVHLNGEPMSMDVPVYVDDTGMAITGAPALLPAATSTARPQTVRIDHDSETAEALTSTVEGFFGAYASADADAEHLSRYVEDGGDITPLPAGVVELVTVSDVLVPHASGDEPRQVQATVVWELLPPTTEDDQDDDEDEDADGPRQITQVYALTMVRDGSAWYVRAVAGAPTVTS